VSPEGYAHLTHLLMGLANGHIILILEVTLSVPLSTMEGQFARVSCVTQGRFLKSPLNTEPPGIVGTCWALIG
jgi:hypothetical protein